MAENSKHKRSEILFWLALAFGAAHFIGISLEIVGQVSGFILDKFPLKSSLFLGNIYLALLSAYAGQKEFSRWQSDPDSTVLGSKTIKKISRGEIIIGLWTLLLGAAVLLVITAHITAVSENLLITVGEVVIIYFGTGASKYLKNKKTARAGKPAAEPVKPETAD